jgi:hypothetical protein
MSLQHRDVGGWKDPEADNDELGEVKILDLIDG